MRRIHLTILAATAASATTTAAELTVRVGSASGPAGAVGCALFAPARSAAFPLDTTRARQVWLAPNTASPECAFHALAPGRYAVAVSLDRNGNHRTDTNWLSLPTEDWAVSNNVRPRLRAPRFDEAAITVADDQPQVIDVRLGR